MIRNDKNDQHLSGRISGPYENAAQESLSRLLVIDAHMVFGRDLYDVIYDFDGSLILEVVAASVDYLMCAGLVCARDDLTALYA